jgi:hypothetical protein
MERHGTKLITCLHSFMGEFPVVTQTEVVLVASKV